MSKLSGTQITFIFKSLFAIQQANPELSLRQILKEMPLSPATRFEMLTLLPAE